MTVEAAIWFAEYAQIMAEGKPDVQEFYRAAELALRAQQERENPKPLTLDELRQMDGEPVWIDDWFEGFNGWELSCDASDYFEGESRTIESYGTRWAAYRHKPKEGKV